MSQLTTEELIRLFQDPNNPPVPNTQQAFIDLYGNPNVLTAQPDTAYGLASLYAPPVEQVAPVPTLPPSAGFWGNVGDAALVIPKSATRLVSSVGGLIDPQGSVRQWGDEATDWLASFESEENRANREENARRIALAKAKGESGWGASWENFVDNPLTTIGDIAESVLPSVAVGVGAAALAPETAGMSLVAAAPMILGGIQGAGETRKDINDHIMAMSQAELNKSPVYLQYIAEGLTPEQARIATATSWTEHGGEVLANGLSSAALERLGGFMKLGKTGGVLNSAGGRFARELGTETADETFQQLTTNKAIHDVDNSHRLTSDLGSAAFGGLLGGGLGGGVAYAQERLAHNFGGEQTGSEQAQMQSDQVVNDIVHQTPTDTTNTAETQPKNTAVNVNNTALDNVLSQIADKDERQAIKQDLIYDIQDGVIEQIATEDNEYGKLAQAYLAEVGQQIAQPTVEQAQNPSVEQQNEQMNSFSEQNNAFSEQMNSFSEQNNAFSEQMNDTQDVRESRSAMKSVEANIARGKERMTQAILNKADVKRAMYHPEWGWIDFVWGDDGTTKPLDKNGEPKGRGIAHIFEARERKNGMSEAETSAMLVDEIVETIAKGTPVNPNPQNKLQLDYRSPRTGKVYRATLVKNKGNNGWVLTAFDNSNKYLSEGANKLGNDSLEPTINSPTLSRADKGASLVASDSGQFANERGLNEQGSDTAFDWRPTNNSQLNDTHRHLREGGAVGADNDVNVTNSQPTVNTQATKDQQTLSQILGNDTASHIEVVDRNTVQPPKGETAESLLAGNVEGWYDPTTQKIYIYSDNITANNVMSREERLAWVAWHELAHRGVNVKLGNRFNDIVTRMGKHPVVERIANTIQKERAEYGDIPFTVAVEEAVAEINAAVETGNWSELESRYNVRIGQSWKNSLGQYLRPFANVLQKVVNAIIGRNPNSTAMTTQELFDVLAEIRQGGTESNTQAENGNGEVRYSFAGERARNANHSLLQQAKDELAQGVDPETIRQKTGWFQGKDGKWRFEINDDSALITPYEAYDDYRFEQLVNGQNGETLEVPLSEVWKDEALFNAYPQLANLKVEIKPLDNKRAGGWFSPNENKIVLSNDATAGQMKSYLVHEVQHVIQNEENFANGSNLNEELKMLPDNTYTGNESIDKRISEIKEQLRQPMLAKEADKLWDEISQLREMQAERNYRNSAGEVEARNAQTRLNMSKEERQNQSPESTEDVKRSNQNVRYLSDFSYSLNEDPNSDFAKAVDAFVNGDEVKTSISLGTTPDVLKMIGLPDVEVKIKRKVLSKVMRGKHAIEPEVLKQLPQQINDPVAVLQSSAHSSNPNGFVVLTELTEFNSDKNRDEPIIVALHLNQSGEVQLLDVASAYGKEHDKLQEMIDNDPIYYWNKTKGSHLANVHWLQLPLKLRSNANLSANDIKTETDLSQYQSENKSDNGTRFSRKAPQKENYQRDLMVTHNLSEENILHADKMGGLPYASLAVTKQNNPLGGFGEVTLIGDRNHIDPKGENKAKVFGSDIYSPRYPRVEARINKEDKSALLKRFEPSMTLDDGTLAYGLNYNVSTLNHRTLLNNLAVRNQFLLEKGIKIEPSYYNDGQIKILDIRNKINQALEGKEDDLSQYIDEIFDEYDIDEKIINQNPNTGKTSYTAHTLENVVKKLKKNVRGGEKNNYGLPNVRAKFTPQFKSISDIQKNKNRIVTKSEFDKALADVEKRLDEIATEMDIDSYGMPDLLEMVVDNGVANAFDHKRIEDTIQNRRLITEAIDLLKAMPTEYFEAKAKDVTQFSDFVGAVIPKDLGKKARSILEKAGLRLYEYGNNRYEVIKQATNELDEKSGGNVLFSRRPKAESLDKLRQSKSIRISGKEIEPSTDLREYKRNALNYGKSLRGTYVNKDTGQEISLGLKAVKEVLDHDYKNPDHLQSVSAIPQIIENAVYIDTLPNEDTNKRPDIESYDYYVAGLNIGGDDYTVRAAIANSENGERYYDHKLSEIEKGELLSTLGITTPNSESNSPLSEIDDKRLLQILQVDNQQKSDKSDNGTRFSRAQTVEDLARTGKAQADPTAFDDLKAKDYDGFKKRFNQAVGKVDEWVADGLRPVNDWIDGLQKEGLSEFETEQLKGKMYRAKGVRDAHNSDIEQKFLKPLLQKVSKIAKKHKLDELSAKRLVGYWASTRYAIEKNKEILERERKEMIVAKGEMELARREALKGDQEATDAYEQAKKAYAKAERQYRYRKHDVESTDSNEEFRVGTAGGWSNPEAETIMRNIEQHIPKAELEDAVRHLYQLNRYRLNLDHEAGRYTEEQYKEFKKNVHYVPLTGDPNAEEDFDGISGAGQNALNTTKDRALKGRKTSEAEDGIDASWRAINKSTTYAGWADFKEQIDDIYQHKVDELVEQGHSEKSAREQVAKTLGITKSKMGGTTRSNDDVLIRKVGGVYYEYGLPKKVMTALKNDNVEYANGFLKALSKPTSWYARGVTQWTVTFAPMNMLRDTWEKSEFIRVQKLFDKDGKQLSSKTMDKIGRAVVKNALLNKDVWNATKRFGFNQDLRTDNQHDVESMLKDLLTNGGVSTYSTYLAKTETDLVKQLQAQNKPIASKLKKAGEILESYNKVFDTVSALSAYKAMIDNGVDKAQAASITLELTNFRKTGVGMRGIKALYMFAQPTAMGARNLIKYLSTKKGQRRFLGYMVVMTALYSALRAMDDDNEGGNIMDQLGDITRYIPLPLGMDKYFKIPVGFGMPQMAWNFATNIVKAANKDISVSEALVNMSTQVFKTIAPISPSEISAANYPTQKLALTFTPSILQPIVQNALNRSAFGNTITPSFVSGDKLKAEQAKSTTAQFWKDLAIGISDTLGIDMHPEQVKNLVDGYSGIFGSLKELSTIFIENPNRELLGRRTRTPFLNQFIGTTNEFAIQSRYYEASEQAQSVANEYKSRKERGKLDGWLTPEKEQIVLHEMNARRMGQLRAVKSKMTKALHKGQMTEEAYQARLKTYNTQMDNVQRAFLKRWRKMQGLSTVE
ncbi:MuF-C-terminal domain-containing protein [Lonepinella sp. BR2357]|uniref:LPD3 domain-containing protein n=1 Tax=Lonepinella sp. BR2357 TaxID=3434549 RepID=UPI003F6DFDCB